MILIRRIFSTFPTDMMVKKFIFLLAAVFLAYQSWRMIINLPAIPFEVLWLDALIAVLLNLFVTGTFAFAGFALPTQRLLPDAYYRVRRPKLLKSVYRRLGVDAFRRFLLATFWRKRTNQKRYFNGRADGLSELDRQSRKSEFGHLFPFLLLVGLCVFLLDLDRPHAAAITLLINVLFNFYPILLQRHHRMRIQPLADRYRR